MNTVLINIPNAVMQSKLKLSSKVLFGRLYVLSKKGTVAIVYSTNELLQDLQISKRSSFDAIAELTEQGLISVQIKLAQGKKVRYVSLADEDTITNFTFEGKHSAKSAPTIVRNLHHENDSKVQNLHNHSAKSALSTFSINSKLIVYSEKAVKKPVKRNSSYPNSADEVLPYFQNYINKYVEKIPKLATLNPVALSISFFEYYSENGWKDRQGKTVRADTLASRVSTWIDHALNPTTRGASSRKRNVPPKSASERADEIVNQILNSQSGSNNIIDADCEVIESQSKSLGHEDI